MNSFTNKITSCAPHEIIQAIAGMCKRLEINAYLFRYLDNGSVFLFVSFDGKELTAVVFGYDNQTGLSSLERQFIVITALETGEVFRVSVSTRGEFESIDCVAALPSTILNETIGNKTKGRVKCVSYVYDIPGNSSREKSDYLTSLFRALRTNQSFSPFTDL